MIKLRCLLHDLVDEFKNLPSHNPYDLRFFMQHINALHDIICNSNIDYGCAADVVQVKGALGKVTLVRSFSYAPSQDTGRI